MPEGGVVEQCSKESKKANRAWCPEKNDQYAFCEICLVVCCGIFLMWNVWNMWNMWNMWNGSERSGNTDRTFKCHHRVNKDSEAGQQYFTGSFLSGYFLK